MTVTVNFVKQNNQFRMMPTANKNPLVLLDCETNDLLDHEIEQIMALPWYAVGRMVFVNDIQLSQIVGQDEDRLTTNELSGPISKVADSEKFYSPITGFEWRKAHVYAGQP